MSRFEFWANGLIYYGRSARKSFFFTIKTCFHRIKISTQKKSFEKIFKSHTGKIMSDILKGCYNEVVRQRRDYKEKPKEAKPLTRNAKRLLLKAKRGEPTRPASM